jgi:ABC-2 type transport system ATP-binding protein
MHDCELMFLDEPTTGLDPQARRTTLDFIKEKVQDGMTVFFTTHNMEEADYICDRIAIIDHGRILAMDTVDGVKSRYGGLSVIHVRVSELNEKLTRKFEELAQVQRVTYPQQQDDPIKVYTKEVETVLPEMIDIATSLGLRIVELGVKEPSLEDVFIQMVDSKRGGHSE